MDIVREIIEALLPAAYMALDHMIWLILGAAVMYLRRWTGVQIDEKHMRALHSAALTGVRMAIEGNLSGVTLRDAAVDYMRASVPDAVKRLTGGDRTILGQIVQAKLQQVLRE